MVREYTLQNARIFLLAVVVGSVSCSSPTPLGPAPPSVPRLAASPGPRIYPQIAVGQTVTGGLGVHDGDNTYELTAPRDGTLRVTVSWDSKDGYVGLRLGNKYFEWRLGNPLVGAITVVAGEKYLVIIDDANPWDGGFSNLNYTFKSSID